MRKVLFGLGAAFLATVLTSCGLIGISSSANISSSSSSSGTTSEATPKPGSVSYDVGTTIVNVIGGGNNGPLEVKPVSAGAPELYASRGEIPNNGLVLLGRNETFASKTPLNGILSVEIEYEALSSSGPSYLELGDENGYYASFEIGPEGSLSLTSGNDFSDGYSFFRVRSASVLLIVSVKITYSDLVGPRVTSLTLGVQPSDRLPIGTALSKAVTGVYATMSDGTSRLVEDYALSASSASRTLALDSVLSKDDVGKIELSSSYLGVHSPSVEAVVYDPSNVPQIESINTSETTVNLYPGESYLLDFDLEPATSDPGQVVLRSLDGNVATTKGHRILALNPGSTDVVLDGGSSSTLVHVNVIDSDKAGVRPTNLVASDFSDVYAPSLGEQKVLIVPIRLAGTSTYEWTQEELNQIADATFSYSRPDSLASYYDKASNGRIHITGEVYGDLNHMYEAKYREGQLQSDTNNTLLYKMFDDCLAWLYEQDDIDLDEYDSDDDGHIDSIHFFVDGSDDNKWQSSLWPHMGTVAMEAGTKEEPTVMSYSLSNLAHLGESAITTIHEQGHIYGIEDYYDYSYEGVDYLGYFDMQSNNVGDWNSFSKMALGWVDPIVVDLAPQEETEVLLKPAALGGSPLLLADSWNGSAYDEYILLELFSRLGNNLIGWDEFRENFGADLGDGGIRLYHADARLAYSDGSGLFGGSFSYLEDTFDLTYGNLVEGRSYQLAHNNSYVDGYYPTFNVSADERTGINSYHLLQVIQKGNFNYFGDPQYGNSARYAFLKEDDLFETGDSFSIENGSGATNYGPTFFENGDSFNNGDEFPYAVFFESVTPYEATIRIKHL